MGGFRFSVYPVKNFGPFKLIPFFFSRFNRFSIFDNDMLKSFTKINQKLTLFYRKVSSNRFFTILFHFCVDFQITSKHNPLQSLISFFYMVFLLNFDWFALRFNRFSGLTGQIFPFLEKPDKPDFTVLDHHQTWKASTPNISKLFSFLFPVTHLQQKRII